MKRIVGLLVAAVGAVLLAATAQATVSYTIASESGSVTYTDIGQGANATCLVFQVTSDTTVPDFWLKLDTSGTRSSATSGPGCVGQLYTIHVSASPAGTYVFSADSDKPSGLSLNPARDSCRGRRGRETRDSSISS